MGVGSIDDLEPGQHTAEGPWPEHSNFEALAQSDLVGSRTCCSPHLEVAFLPAVDVVCRSVLASA